MNVTVVLDHMFYQTPDGSVWTEMTMPYSFWTRYLSVFDRVRVIGRMQKVDEAASHWLQADGNGVLIEGVGAYHGPFQYVTRSIPIYRQLSRKLAEDEAYLLRLPSNLGFIAASMLAAQGQAFGVEVVGDPYDVFSPGGVRHPLRPLFRYWFTCQLKKSCRTAAAVAYVTAEALQRRYPPAQGAYTTHYSSIELSNDWFVSSPRSVFRVTGQRLIAVGSLAQLYKAPDVLLQAVNLLSRQGLDISLVWVGGGRHLEEMQALTNDLGLQDRVRFTGIIASREAIRRELDNADLFVLPSRTEGLPRAMIEAMARGLPCVGTAVGGIPELLDDSCLVPPNDPSALAKKIEDLLLNPRRMAELSARNLRVAQEYRDDCLYRRRNGFYRTIMELTIRARGNA